MHHGSLGAGVHSANLNGKYQVRVEILAQLYLEITRFTTAAKLKVDDAFYEAQLHSPEAASRCTGQRPFRRYLAITQQPTTRQSCPQNLGRVSLLATSLLLSCMTPGFLTLMMSIPQSPTPVKMTSEAAVPERWQFIDSIYNWDNVSLTDATACTPDRTCLACITGDQKDTIQTFVTLCHTLRLDRAKNEGALDVNTLASLIREYESHRTQISQLLESVPVEMRTKRAEPQAPLSISPSPPPAVADQADLEETVLYLKDKSRLLKARMKTMKQMIRGQEATMATVQRDQKLTLDRIEDLQRLFVDQSTQIRTLLENLSVQLGNQLGNLSAQIGTQVGALSAQLGDQIGTLQAQSVQTGEKVGTLSVQSVQLESQLGTLSTQSVQLESQLGNLSVQLGDQIGTLSARSVQLESQLGTLQAQTGSLSAQIATLCSPDLSIGRRRASAETARTSPMIIQPSIESPPLTQPERSIGSAEHSRASSVVTRPSVSPSIEMPSPFKLEDGDLPDVHPDNLTDVELPERKKQVSKPDLILKKIIPSIHQDIDNMVPGCGPDQKRLNDNLRLILQKEYLEGVDIGDLDAPGRFNYQNIRLTRGGFLYAFERWSKITRAQRNQFYEYYRAAANNRERRYVIAYFQSDAIFSDGTKIHTLPNTGPPKVNDTRFPFLANWYFHDLHHLPEHPALERYDAGAIAYNARNNQSSHLDRQILASMHNSERYEEVLKTFRKYRVMLSSRQREFRELYWQGTPAERFILLEGLIYNIDVAKTEGWKNLATKEHETRFARGYPRHPHVPGVDVSPRVGTLATVPRGQKRPHSEVESGQGDE
ncbi:hypothetical protein V8F20_006149 [Naviculisporaceae sp. PSN 640]